MFGGISIASVLGVPIINVIGQHRDWRVAFGALSGLSPLTALLMAAALPTIRAEGSVGGAALAGVLRNRALWMAYAVAIFTVAAHFGVFTFIEPYLRQMPGVAPAAVALLLFGFGAAGLLGNVLTGLAIDQHFKTVIVAALAFMCAALIGLGWLVPRAGGAAAIPASALYTTVFNGASGIGAMPGASILARSGLSAVMLAAGGGVACAACLVVAASPEGKA
ncbi:hypothetical protein WT26_28770 [Burkholderia cepacia]|uniref:MFS transporter n=2 Tax=Burkholderia cepacia complex TaxID=87882 RepID=A0A1B4Q0Y7_BURCE|nr:hypothetical protein WT26_28770 [Burkholderia cepacia]AOK26616.1 hypothetical protein WK67_28660 [Burkholderia ubonensis]